ncbi:MAG: pyruvate:ferredoxin (flavodoxin) oxidoreductase [Oscillospiraceae bacterium]|nr:pyruvate:ferredoxin (flavodoxin) oxidoreductase [Oscillospiraceae bacterium]
MRKLKTMDGNTAAAHVAYAFSEVAAIYPITPSSPMAESMDIWAADDRTNIFGSKVQIVEMQSEGGAAGAVHGAVAAGSYSSTFTASQGLLLMIPNMYKLAGEQTPTVFHVAARALASHALNIFGDHSDVMSCRQTGFGMLCSNNVQQCMDLAAVAHLSAISGRVPMLHFFDGFRTSHESQKIEIWDYDELASMVDYDAVKAYKASALHPAHPYCMGSAEQPETFFQHREACNTAYINAADVVAKYMDVVNEKLGTNYKPFTYYGAADAEDIIVAMGSVCDAAEEVVDYLNAKGGKVGIIEVHLYRPFSVKYLLNVLPESVKRIAVLDRTKEPGSIGEPLYLDVSAALRGTAFEHCLITHGRYGLGSKDTQPEDILAVYKNLRCESPKIEFTVSIKDDITNLSLDNSEIPDIALPGTVACKFWGLGSDGTVGANKNSVKIIGDHTDKKVQAYFQYDSKKSGGVTISHLRFGDTPIKASYYIRQADFVACHQVAYLGSYDMVSDVKPGGTFLLNCSWSDAELEANLPAKVRSYIAKNNIKFYTCDAVSAAKKVGLGAKRTNTVLQAAFFKLANVIPIDDAVRYMEEAIVRSYGKNGQKVIDMNIAAVHEGLQCVHEVKVPESWLEAGNEGPARKQYVGRDEAHTKYLNSILHAYATLSGDNLPVSEFMDTVNGAVPSGNAAFEKRGTAVDVPAWDVTGCMQCNLCATVCPHGAIRPFAVTKEEAEKGSLATSAIKKSDDYLFSIGISVLDCTGCGSCVDVCPAKDKALYAVKLDSEISAKSQKDFDYMNTLPEGRVLPFDDTTIKGVQFNKPLLEFSGACPGCGETPYAKLVTQLFGDRMYIANATGCSSIWGNSLPSTPYTVNAKGRGPAWANSLFEDNAEFGLGMALSVKSRREQMRAAVRKLTDDKELVTLAVEWLGSCDDAKAAEASGEKLLEACMTSSNPDAKYIVDNKDMLIKPSVWIFGGDGWAYDIGYGGLDHVIASGENVNILVFDTEVYSNTGGQSSKSTPTGAVAQFAAAGKKVKKKDLASIAMEYGYVYVAQIAMGANPAQTLRAIREAEAYDGPSLIIAYAPCINHGVKAGMNKSMAEMKNAVTCGYWNLLRYDPRKTEAGENPLSLDSAKPTGSYRDFLSGEVRYASLVLKNKERAEELFAQAEKDALARYAKLEGLAKK